MLICLSFKYKLLYNLGVRGRSNWAKGVEIPGSIIAISIYNSRVQFLQLCLPVMFTVEKIIRVTCKTGQTGVTS